MYMHHILFETKQQPFKIKQEKKAKKRQKKKAKNGKRKKNKKKKGTRKKTKKNTLPDLAFMIFFTEK